MIWKQEADALVSRLTKATFKIFNRSVPGGLSITESRSQGEISIVLITPHEHYCIAKVDQEDEGMRFCEWVARAMNYEA
jgi:hypothetical protein